MTRLVRSVARREIKICKEFSGRSEMEMYIFMRFINLLKLKEVKVKVKQSHYRPGVAQRVKRS